MSYAKQIKSLCKQAADAYDADEALKLSQAAVNLATVYAHVSAVQKMECEEKQEVMGTYEVNW